MAAGNYDDVLRQLTAAGLLLDPREGLRVGTSKPVRCKVQDAGREKRGWYWLHEFTTSAGNLLIVGSYGVWRGSVNNVQKIELGKTDPFTADQVAALKRRLAEDRKQAELERAREADAAARTASAAWARLAEDGDSPYLKQKGVAGYGARYTRNHCAVIPLVDTAGKIHGLQFLRTATQAKECKRPTKEFWPPGIIKKGHFHLLGHQPHWIILVAEGYATAASLHAATGYPVACAFDAGNLLPVAEALRKRYKRARILICADDDCFTDGNPGVTAASAAALAVSGEWVKPAFADEEARRAKHAANGHKLTDFNDLQSVDGAAAVGAQIEARLLALRWTPPPLRGVSSSTTGAGGGKLRPIQLLDDLLQRFAYVYGSDSTVFDRSEHCLMTLTAMKNGCIRADLHKAWMEHPERDIVRETEVGFDPAGEDPAVTCNLWGGWPTQPKSGSCERLLDLLAYMCSGERNARELYQWVLKWVAYPIQHPGAKMKTTVVIHGMQGTGKNLFFEAVMGIYGHYGRILDQDALVDKHNDWASRKLFLIADEVVAQAHRFEHKNKLKTLITGTQIRINPKHVAAHDEANHCNLVFLSNENMPVVLEEDDRRHCVIWTPPPKPDEYYRALSAEMYDGGIAALHDYLLHLDLGDFNPHTKPPNTQAKSNLIDLAQDSPIEFYDKLWARDVFDFKPGPGLTQDWFSIYARWCSSVGIKPASLKRFSHSLAHRRGEHAVRKRYMLERVAGIPEEVGPHSVMMFDQSVPEGDDERAWLGVQIGTLKNRLHDLKGGNAW